MEQVRLLCHPGGYRPSTLSSHSLAVEQVLLAMRTQLSEPLSLEEMAKIACLSPFHFNRTFRTMVGVPPGEFLAVLRMNAAKRRLLTTSLSVTEVCFDLGYASPGTFANRFKQLVGLSPLQFRQFADAFAPTSLEPLHEGSQAARNRPSVHDRGVSGSIAVPGSFQGLIFIGLFPKPIPLCRPVACRTISTPGRYQIATVPDGRYYLLAAALPWSQNALTYLLPEAGLLVGVAKSPVFVVGGRGSTSVDLTLRLPQPADPPILGVFPPLLRTPGAARVISLS